MKKLHISFLFTLLFASVTFAQLDTVKYQWPVPPLNESQGLNATFSEFRNTGSVDHFHNAVDIGEPDGNPVYASMDGIVHTVAPNSGSNSYVRVRTEVNGQWKHLTYLHIVPNPSLSVGDVVKAGIDIVGTIYPGQGHVHLIERELVTGINTYAVEINNVREGGGLDPYIDTYAPIISGSTLEFRLNGTETVVPDTALAEQIDILIRIEEQNGPNTIHRNNGTYLLGYRIWNEAKTAVVYEPFDEGVVYRFDTKPFDTDVHNVFVEGIATLSNPYYYITNGEGAEKINDDGFVTDNYFDTKLVPEGSYNLEVFSEDTRGNKTNAFYPIKITRDDILPPAPPEFLTVLNTDGREGVSVTWEQSIDPDLAGYRLYYSQFYVSTGGSELSDWQLAADENILTGDVNSIEFINPTQFQVPADDFVYFFKLTAIDSAGNESGDSDIYSRSSYTDGTAYPKALIVDGFDRFGGSGSWDEPSHFFNTEYMKAMTVADSVVISSVSNEAVFTDEVSLSDYDMVIWFTGDESTNNNTFTNLEQVRIVEYLENGGNVFISGAEVGWDLDRPHDNAEASDTLFYRHYLKAKYMYDGTSSMNRVTGVEGTDFEGIESSLGLYYPEDYPDDIEPINGSHYIFNYNSNRSANELRKAGVAYAGTFGESSIEGKVVYISFPFEVMSNFQAKIDMMKTVMNFFDATTAIDDEKEVIPVTYSLSQNYPNPFNPSTTFNITLPKTNKVSVKIYDILGRLVDTIADKEFTAGRHTLTWNAKGMASGVYYVNMRSGSFTQTRNIILLK